MNYKSITWAFLATIVLISCKKEIKMDENKTIKIETTASTERSAINPNGKFAKMNFTKLEHDFGAINGNDVVETVFTFTNTGEADLVISNAKGSCGCTVPEYPKEPIAPGQEADIKVSFSPKGKNGMQNKTVTLTTNTATGMENLTVKANIVK